MNNKWLRLILQLFINKSELMLTGILRIGPFVILQVILLGLSLAIYLFEALPQCYVFTLVELAFIFFLIETYTSLRIMKHSPKMRKQYIKQRIEEEKLVFYCRLIWDNLNIIAVVILLYSALVADGVQLTTSIKGIAPASYQDNNSQCQYSLFSICLFADLIKQCSFSTQDTMIVWMLYAATTFLISILCIIVSKQYYQYCSSLHQNRKLLIQNGSMSQTLLDCNIYRISQTTTINEEVRESLGACSICMHQLLDKCELSDQVKIIKLSCGHHFHQECIHKWLKVKDNCPYRCLIDQS